jgi:hypothetical protein
MSVGGGYGNEIDVAGVIAEAGAGDAELQGGVAAERRAISSPGALICCNQPR